MCVALDFEWSLKGSSQQFTEEGSLLWSLTGLMAFVSYNSCFLMHQVRMKVVGRTLKVKWSRLTIPTLCSALPIQTITFQWLLLNILMRTYALVAYLLHTGNQLLFRPRWQEEVHQHDFHYHLILQKMALFMSMQNNIMGFLGEGVIVQSLKHKTNLSNLESPTFMNLDIFMHWIELGDLVDVFLAKRSSNSLIIQLLTRVPVPSLMPAA